MFAEDNYLVREGAAALLATADDLELVATVSDLPELLAAVEELAPDAVLTDIRMPPSHTDEGIRAALQIRRDHPATGVVVNSATSITAVSPATLTPGIVDVHVVTSGGTSSNGAGDQFTYQAVQPAVTSVSPTHGTSDGGDSVTITGTNFINGASVSFGLAAAASVTVNSPTQITAVTPSTSPGTVDVTITTTGGTSATSPADQFTFFAIPTVTAVSPNTGPTGGGTHVTISGTNFAPGWPREDETCTYATRSWRSSATGRLTVTSS